MLDVLTHLMCWDCWKDKLGETTEPGIENADHTTDHCCWCGHMTDSGIYWGNGRIQDYDLAEPACGGHGGAHPHIGDSTPFVYRCRPHEDEDYSAPNE